MFKKIVLVLTVLFALAGSVIDGELTAMHVSTSARPAWFADTCTPQGHPAYDCKEVLKSRYAVVSPLTFSFVEPDPESGAQEGIPVALLGWYYFSVLFVWYALIGRVSPERRVWHGLVLLLVVCGCLTSAGFLYLLVTRMDVKCIWCIVSHALNFGILIGTVLLWPRKQPAPVAAPVDAGAAAVPSPSPASPTTEPHPSLRLLIATLACALVVLYAENTTAQREQYKTNTAMYKLAAERWKQEVDAVAEDTEGQLARFMSQKPANLHIRKDDPQCGSGELLLTMVIFSDFECPYCSRFAADVEKQIVPRFDNLVRVVWKHYPLCKDCNPYPKFTLHKRACKAAFAAEAARLQGGNDAFWKAHDLLFARQKKLARFDYRALAVELGLDPDRFIADMNGDAARQRIREDVDLAKSLGVTGTPSVFLWNRRVPGYALKNNAFLEAIKREFHRVRNAQLRQQETKAANHEKPRSSPTPDIPGQPAAP